MRIPPVSDWQLPPGVTRSLWDYAHAEHIADEYDEYFAYNQLFGYDAAVLAEHFTQPGRLVDLGCGTGRLLFPFAERGFHCLAVDLSAEMLRVVDEKSQALGQPIDRVRANLVELDCLADGCADYVILMFSTLGMIRQDRHRRQVLAHVRRILRPGGLLVCHVHNRWYHLYDPQGRWWLLTGWWQWLVRRRLEPGDKIYHYCGIPNMFLHTFTQREFRHPLRDAGLAIQRFIPLDTQRQRPLRRPWLLPSLRANGWIAVCK